MNAQRRDEALDADCVVLSWKQQLFPRSSKI